MFDFEHQLKILPDKPGVYIMKNSLGEVIYVGKAKILKNRVRQYFQNSKNHSVKVKAMVKNISEFEYIVTDSEMEALILEGNLIKKYNPKYNIALKDDKFYPFIKITTNEDFPRVYMTRNFVKDGNKYFGPYTSSASVHEVMDLIKKNFPLRTCKKVIKEGGETTKPCLNYHLNLCKAPCSAYITKNDYKQIIDDIVGILSGKNLSILSLLKKDMVKFSDDLDFENAAKLRDKILAIESIVSKQKMFILNYGEEDFIDVYSDEKDSCVQVFFVRNGKVTGREHFMIENTDDSPREDIISEFITRFYGGTAKIPKEVYVSKINDLQLLEAYLTQKKGKKVNIKIPKKGIKKEMLDMVWNNAKITLTQFKDKMIKDKKENIEALESIVEKLELDSIPERIEAYDISNIQGVDSVGSMVVFENGKAKNSDYRRFKIKTIDGPNDYKSMEEILQRRFVHGLEEIKMIQKGQVEYSNGKFSIFPDLIMMDGGKGQVNIALDILKKLNINIPVCGLVKDNKHNTRGIIYNNKEIIINKNSSIMRLITRIQDEVHRFAITYHRSLRDNKSLYSLLNDIPRIGEKRRRNLLVKFGNIENIKKASMSELLDTPSIDKAAAQSILDYFSNSSSKNIVNKEEKNIP